MTSHTLAERWVNLADGLVAMHTTVLEGRHTVSHVYLPAIIVDNRAALSPRLRFGGRFCIDGRQLITDTGTPAVWNDLVMRRIRYCTAIYSPTYAQQRLLQLGHKVRNREAIMASEGARYYQTARVLNAAPD